METQLFIHHNLVQHKILALFMWQPYHDTARLYDNIVISYLRSLMPWYDKREVEHFLFIGLDGSYDFATCLSSTHFFTKYLTLEFFSSLSNYTNI